MLLKALDLLRRLGWGIINFIYNLIDTLFDVLKSLNAYNIIDSVADNSLFSNFLNISPELIILYLRIYPF